MRHRTSNGIGSSWAGVSATETFVLVARGRPGRFRGVFPVIVDDGQFQVALEWSAGYRLPIHQGNMCRSGFDDFDLHHCFMPRLVT
jgi:hypothetical protein